MKRKTKIFLPFTLITVSLLSAGTVNASTTPANNETPVATEIAPRVYFHHYNKTITYYYSNRNSIPTSTYYQEYNNSFNAWFKGTLHLKSTRRSNGGYYATYKGQLSGA